MPRRLILDSLKTELSSVHELLNQASNAGDPVGELQFAHRYELLKSKVDELEGAIATHASVALFFGGKPVLGSKGISAEFAGGALEKFQDLVTRTFAQEEIGQLGKKGPIPQKNNTKLMVTELARGSFGFVLDEMSEQSEIQETALKLMVDEVAHIVEETGSPYEPDFEAMVESLDPRTLIALKEFFYLLDNSEATIRLVDDKRDFLLDKSAIHRGRVRTEATSIDEIEEVANGELLGLLPEHRKFEFKPVEHEAIYGTVSKFAAEQYQQMIDEGSDVVKRKWRVKLKVRTVKPLNRTPKEVYQLIEFLP